jgi:ligand-binding SRPBCC domain-containing protein
MSFDPYIFRQEHWIQRPIDEVFSFFSEARNLEEITPPWVGFRILSMSTGSIQEGTEIRYRLRLHGVPIHWLTEILEWNPPYKFVDVQRSGPYKLWRHTHEFEAVDGGTRMIDNVEYALPFGVLGRIAHAMMVRRDVQQIFNYRRQRIETVFNAKRGSAN